MAVKYATGAFVFKREDRLESDRVFSVYTKEFGRLEVTGKALRKIDSKLRGGIELFSFSDIEFIQGKKIKTLTDAVSHRRFTGVFKDPGKYGIALDICSLVDACINGEEKDERIFNLLADVFSKLDSGRARRLIYYYFFWNFISLLGYGPEITGKEIPKDAADILRFITQKDWAALEALTIPVATQKLFQKVSDTYYLRVMESHV